MRNFGILLLSTSLALAAEPALTIYNQNFAVVRESIPLALRAGPNSVRFAGATAYVEPESVILRDPSGRVALQILEQNYRADPVSSELLLSLYEGKTLDFLVQNAGQTQIVAGKIVRSGYAARRGQTPQFQGPGMPPGQPIIEVEGKLRFQLPGMPLFPALGDDTIVQPVMDWTIQSAAAAKLDAELCYITGGMNWESDYNLISPGTGDALEVIGWVTIENQSGKTFENTRIKLMAGD
ncbi:MAG: hypothetical protein HY013_08525, partial [Candidatus Solibacter usitatus]|nr:hypothetical protein [Candidatus Solibacter usitatus]